MTKLFLKRVGFYLVPEGHESVCALGELPLNKSFMAEVKQPRNPQFHRLYFALCKRIGDGVGQDAEAISTVFKFATNHCETIRSKTHGELKIPKSISFSKMDNAEFRKFFDACVTTALDVWGIEYEALSDLIDTPAEKRA